MNHYWKTKNGRILKLSEMDDNHLQNVFDFLVRVSYGSDVVRMWPISIQVKKEIERRKNLFSMKLQIV